MQKIETEEQHKHNESCRSFATLKVEKVKEDMNKITRRLSRFNLHIEDIKQKMGDTGILLIKIKQDIEELESKILTL